MQFLKEIKEIETNYEELLATVETTNLIIQSVIANNTSLNLLARSTFKTCFYKLNS